MHSGITITQLRSYLKIEFDHMWILEIRMLKRDSFRYLTFEISAVLYDIDFDAGNQYDILRNIKKLIYK